MSLNHVLAFLYQFLCCAVLQFGPPVSEIQKKLEPGFDSSAAVKFSFWVFSPEVQILFPKDIQVKEKQRKCVGSCVQTSPSGPNCEKQTFKTLKNNRRKM